MRRHDWTDWAGFSAFTFLWVGVVVTSPSIGLMTLPLIVHPVLSSLGFLLRKQKISDLRGLAPRFAGYAGSFGVLVFLMVAGIRHPDWVTATVNPRLRNFGLAVWFAGAVLDACVVYSLRHAMSIIPQARTLITTGPYRYARHPLYAAYMLQNFGLLLRLATVPLAAVLLVWAAVTLIRIRFEERVLTAAFPEYVDYAQRVGMLFPRLAPRRPAQASGSAAAADREVALAQASSR